MPRTAQHPDGKASKIGVSLYPPQIEHARKRAKEAHAGNLSTYIQSLIDADAGNAPMPAADDPDLLLSLARHLRGTLFASDLAELLPEGCEQPRLLVAILEDYAIARRRAIDGPRANPKKATYPIGHTYAPFIDRPDEQPRNVAEK